MNKLKIKAWIVLKWAWIPFCFAAIALYSLYLLIVGGLNGLFNMVKK